MAADQPKGTGLLMGQVVDASSGKPVAGAIVSITGGAVTTTVLPTGEVIVSNAAAAAAAATPTSAPRQIMTDSGGRFMFRELTHGRYSIRISAPGYLAGGYGQARPGGAVQSIELGSDDEKRGDLTARVWKSASVNGTITDESGDPAVGYPVRVIRRTMSGGRPRLAPGLTATTDDRGTYRAANLIPGDYLVAVMSTQTTIPVSTADAYVQQAGSGASIITSDIYRELNGSDAPMPSMGGYRVGDLILQPGISGRGGGSAPTPAPADDGRVFTYPTQFYPAAGAAAQASVLTLASGEDKSGIDLQLRLMPAVRVSGIVIGPEGPVRNLGVKLLPAGADEFTTESGIEAASTATDARGVFTFLGVTPGQYTLKSLRMARPPSSSSSTMTTIEVSGPNGMIMGMSSGGPSSGPPPPLPTELTLSATMPVSVGESDVIGLSVSLRTGVRIGGRLAFEGSKEPPTPDQLQRASVSISPVGGSAPIQMALSAKRVETDGRFNSVGYPPGRYVVSASLPVVSGGGATGWTMKSAMFSGHDVSDEGIEISTEDIAGIVITFTDRTTELSGTVLDARGQPDKGATVIIIPADSQGWKQGVTNARRLRSVRTTTTGMFSAANLPPGDYLIAAVSDSTLGEWQDPKFLEKVAAVATRVTLDDGEKKSEQLTTKTIR
jgi:protocatechuate 3,4-dioxygenase beta subunit